MPRNAHRFHRARRHRKNAAGIALRVNEGESDESAWIARNQFRERLVRLSVVAVECGENDGLVNARGSLAAKIWLDRGFGIPWRSEPVALARMAAAIDDHRGASPNYSGFDPAASPKACEASCARRNCAH